MEVNADLQRHSRRYQCHLTPIPGCLFSYFQSQIVCREPSGVYLHARTHTFETQSNFPKKIYLYILHRIFLICDFTLIFFIKVLFNLGHCFIVSTCLIYFQHALYTMETTNSKYFCAVPWGDLFFKFLPLDSKISWALKLFLWLSVGFRKAVQNS